MPANHDRSCRLPLLGLLVLASTATAAAPAWADAVKFQLQTRVAEGQQPRLKLIVSQPLDQLQVELQRADGGKTVSARFADVPAGSTRDVLFPGEPGTHRWSGKIILVQGGQSRENPFSVETVVAPKLQVSVDRARVDVPGRRLEVRMSRPAGKVELKVFGPTGSAPLDEQEHDFTGRPAGEPLVVTWSATGEVARLDLRAHDADGFWQALSLFPWSVYIPHEEVNFATDSAAIAADQAPKLEASLKQISQALARHRDLGPIKLYIAGHTDTVGGAAYNVSLSQRRAASIASWFRQRGLKLPIAYEGFGEHALLVATPDNKDEARNRRVDYILAIEDPVLKTNGHRASWKRLP